MISKLDQKLLTLNNRHFFILDAIVFLATPLLSIFLRLDRIAALEQYKYAIPLATLIFLVIKLGLFCNFGVYRRYWRYASIDELNQITNLISVAVIIEFILISILNYFSYPDLYLFPRSLPLLDGILSLVLVGGIRFSLRLVERENQNKRKRFYRRDRVLIVGAGNAGVSMLNNIQRNPKLGLYPVAFIDDDPQKLNLQIRGIPIVGNHFQLPEIISSLNIRQVVIAMPTAPGKVIREIVDICQAIGIKTSTIPSINEILDNRQNLNVVREVKIEDLLRREPIETDTEKVLRFTQGKKVLITGAGGSIGSELCRQIFRCRPEVMVLVGHGENSIFNIQQELQQVLQILQQENNSEKKLTNIVTFIADLRFRARVEQAFKKYQPDVVFHAAAHKHVPLMEANPAEAITNNVIGTKNLVDLAVEYDVQKLVMISTDKAVNPTNVMGASKRVAEMMVLQAAKTSGKPFVVVRFGNVLGSRGSVVPTFKKQIAKGGPVTITHPEICRYFMTIPEAVQLVLQASVLDLRGQILMLNMGQPVKIVDLAKDLIRLSGYEVGKDIDIIFTGLRPGEKLYEELFIPGEEYEPTQHQKLLVVKNASKMVVKNLDLTVSLLHQAAVKNNTDLILFLLEQLVTGYQPKYALDKIPKNILDNQPEALLSQSIPEKKEALSSKFVSSRNLITQDIEQAFQRALSRQEFCIHYQPIVELTSEKIIELEALLRWNHPHLGQITPVKFISLAEETGSIVPITNWLIEEVCRQLYTWQQEFFYEGKVSINIPSVQLLQPSLVKQLQRNLTKYNLTPNSLVLEIAENVLRENPHSAIAILPQLRALGIQLQIDNLGRLGCLHNQFQLGLLYEQFDRVKIDRYLVNRMDKDKESLELIDSIIAQVQSSPLQAIATGIENQQQLNQLKAIDCNYGQGYLFYQPIQGTELKNLVSQKQMR
ncbi:MAG: polysaccharide biosynthesis protein [Xenococcaceae cyanobacterium MO_188.B29]|nr:polysaccharide biosynthesis protein [Xenococcaceae cyanobacterium MO_188.B29]